MGAAASLPYGMGSPSTKAVDGAVRAVLASADLSAGSTVGPAPAASSRSAGLPPLHPPHHSHLRPSPSGRSPREPFLMSSRACLAEGWDVVEEDEASLSPEARGRLSGEWWESIYLHDRRDNPS